MSNCDFMDDERVGAAKPLETHEKWIVALAVIGWVVFIGFMLGITIF